MAALSDDYIKGFNDGVNYERHKPEKIIGTGYTDGCSVCGLKFSGPMGYVCPNNNCPTKVTCTTNTLYTPTKYCNFCNLDANRVGGCAVSVCRNYNK
jgi:hypothetical protein